MVSRELLPLICDISEQPCFLAVACYMWENSLATQCNASLISPISRKIYLNLHWQLIPRSPTISVEVDCDFTVCCTRFEVGCRDCTKHAVPVFRYVQDSLLVRAALSQPQSLC